MLAGDFCEKSSIKVSERATPSPFPVENLVVGDGFGAQPRWIGASVLIGAVSGQSAFRLGAFQTDVQGLP